MIRQVSCLICLICHCKIRKRIRREARSGKVVKCKINDKYKPNHAVEPQRRHDPSPKHHHRPPSGLRLHSLLPGPHLRRIPHAQMDALPPFAGPELRPVQGRAQGHLSAPSQFQRADAGAVGAAVRGHRERVGGVRGEYEGGLEGGGGGEECHCEILFEMFSCVG